MRASSLRRSRVRPGLAALVVVGALVLAEGAHHTGWLQALEVRVYDARVIDFAGDDIAAVEPRVSIVIVDEQDIRRFGHPLRDREITSLLDSLLAMNPRAIGIDLYRDMPVPRAAGDDPLATTPDHDALGRRVLSDPRVVMTMRLPDMGGPGTPPPSFLDSDEQLGFSDLPVDSDGRVRRGLVYLWQDGVARYSLALQLAARHLAAQGVSSGPAEEDGDLLQLGETVVVPIEPDSGPYVSADAAGYQFLLDFGYGAHRFPSHRFGEVLDGNVDADAFRDRVVLVGTMAPSVKDTFRTVLDGPEDRPLTYGVEIHAHATDQLIRFGLGESRPLRTLGSAPAALITLLMAAIGASLGLVNRSLSVQIAIIAAAVVAFLLATDQAFSAGLFLPVVPPLLAVILASACVVTIDAALDRAERRALAGLFSRFQGPAVAEQIWRQRDEFIGPGGRPLSLRVVLTSLMSDLEGYTSASETLSPDALMSWLNEYMNAMADIVEAHGGVVDDYAGDGIKANFGFPAASETEEAIDAQASAAVRCAVAMAAKMDALNQDWRARGLPSGRCRVGLFTGPAVVGCIGGDRSLKYTSIGDTINTAARLESFAKDDFLSEGAGSSCRILIGEETFRRVEGQFEIVALGRHSLKGKQEPVPIYRVLAKRPGA